jgi:hypothetical protein
MSKQVEKLLGEDYRYAFLASSFLHALAEFMRSLSRYLKSLDGRGREKFLTDFGYRLGISREEFNEMIENLEMASKHIEESYRQKLEVIIDQAREEIGEELYSLAKKLLLGEYSNTD